MTEAYGEKCFFDSERSCPLSKTKVDGKLCQACVSYLLKEGTLLAAQMTKMSIISTLLLTYREETKAKEIYEKIVKFTKEWGRGDRPA